MESVFITFFVIGVAVSIPFFGTYIVSSFVVERMIKRGKK